MALGEDTAVPTSASSRKGFFDILWPKSCEGGAILPGDVALLGLDRAGLSERPRKGLLDDRFKVRRLMLWSVLLS